LKQICCGFSPSAGKFGEGVQVNDNDACDKKNYLSEHDLSKFVSSMAEIG
jgi:hypothetical protein